MKITINSSPAASTRNSTSALATAEGREPFIVVKGCRIVDGKNGAFVSWPATKNADSEQVLEARLGV